MGCEQSCREENSYQILRTGRRDAKKKNFKFQMDENDATTENVTKIPLKLTEKDFSLIQKILSHHFFFYKLNRQQKVQLFNQIEIYGAQANKVIFKQGDPATMFFLIRSGSVKVEFGINSDGGRILKQGQYFGELALLYKAPRSATITTLQKSQFFCISHRTFRRTMQEVTIKNYENAKQYIQDASIFHYLTPREKNAIAYNAHTLKYQKGQIIFKEGDDAISFFVVIKGKISIEIPGKPSIIMREGQSFGQNSFQKKQTRNGTAIALQRSSLLSIGSEALRKCIGTALEELNQENIIKWALRRHQVLKNLSDLQREKILSIAVIQSFEDNSIIFRKGNIADSFIICLGGRVNEGDVGSIHNLEFIFEKQQNQLRITKAFVKHGNGKIAFFSFEAINKALGNSLQKCLDQRPTVIIKQIRLKKEYIQTIKLQQLNVKFTLGEGMFGKVLCVEDPCKKLYALKCIQKNSIIKQGLQNFILNEKKYLQQIDSPFVVELYKTFTDQNFVYFLMKFIDGGDFFQILHSCNEFLKEQVQFYLGCLINAIQALHEKNIIYRDIKPENAVTDKEGYLYLVDLGTAKRLTQHNGFKTFTIIGTPHYMAPEVIQGQGYSFPVDFWSLGVFLFEMIHGIFPFGDDSDDPYEIFKKIESQDLQFPSQCSDPTEIILLQKLLSKDERERQIQDFSKLKNMAYFDDFNWDELDRKVLDTPFTINRENLNKPINKPLLAFLENSISNKNNQQKQRLFSNNKQWNQIFQDQNVQF